jgi:hypothetical protein
VLRPRALARIDYQWFLAAHASVASDALFP